MKSVLLSILKSTPQFLAKSSVNLKLEGWPAAVSVCGFSGAMLGIAYMAKKELEERRLSEEQRSKLKSEGSGSDLTDQAADDTEPPVD